MIDLTGPSFELPHIPARDNAGLQAPRQVGDDIVTDMEVPEAMLDEHGLLAPGALAVLADSAIGFAVVGTINDGRAIATSHLHLELLRPVPVRTSLLRCAGRLVHVDGSYGLGAGSIEDADGSEIARSTVGFVLLEFRTIRAPTATAHQLPQAVPRDWDGCVDDLLGTDIATVDDRGCVARYLASADVSNLTNGVHGGMGVLMAERTMDRALRATTDGGGSFRLVEVRASFPRPIASTGDCITCTASVVHRGRRLVLVRAELHDQRQRTAVVVDGTYVASDTTA